jgi:colicin import membrane protein
MKMRRFSCSIFLFVSMGMQGVCTTGAMAQMDSAEAESQRAKIEAARQALSQRLNEKERQCAQKFAVTLCTEQVRAERLAEEKKLKQQLAQINDFQRHERGLEQKQRSQEKFANQAEKMAHADLVSQEKRTDGKSESRMPTQPTGTPRARTPQPANLPTVSDAQRSANNANYQKKQDDATKKRAEVAKRLQEANPKKRGLPRPAP